MKVVVYITFILHATTIVHGVGNIGLTRNDYDFNDDDLNSLEELTSIDIAKESPSLTCIISGVWGCQLMCKVECRLYGCESKAVCRNGIYCECNEVYTFSNSKKVSADQFGEMSLDDLWYYRFKKDCISPIILCKIKADPALKENVGILLSNPHQTGEEIKQALIKQIPEFIKLKNLKVEVHGEKNELVKGSGQLEYDNLGKYFGDLFSSIPKVANRLNYQLRLMKMLRYIRSKEELMYVMNQVNATGNEELKFLVSNLLKQMGISLDNMESGVFDTYGFRCVNKKKLNYNKTRPDRIKKGTFSGDGKPPVMKVTLTNGGNPIYLELNEDRIIELSIINEILKAANAGGRKQQQPQQLISQPGAPMNPAQNNKPLGNWENNENQYPAINNKYPTNSNFVQLPQGYYYDEFGFPRPRPNINYDFDQYDKINLGQGDNTDRFRPGFNQFDKRPIRPNIIQTPNHSPSAQGINGPQGSPGSKYWTQFPYTYDEPGRRPIKNQMTDFSRNPYINQLDDEKKLPTSNQNSQGVRPIYEEPKIWNQMPSQSQFDWPLQNDYYIKPYFDKGNGYPNFLDGYSKLPDGYQGLPYGYQRLPYEYLKLPSGYVKLPISNQDIQGVGVLPGSKNWNQMPYQTDEWGRRPGQLNMNQFDEVNRKPTTMNEMNGNTLPQGLQDMNRLPYNQVDNQGRPLPTIIGQDNRIPYPNSADKILGLPQWSTAATPAPYQFDQNKPQVSTDSNTLPLQHDIINKPEVIQPPLETLPNQNGNSKTFPTLQLPQISNLIPGAGNIPNIIPANQLMNKLPNPSNFLSNPNTNQISDELQQGLNPINKIPYQPNLNTHIIGPTLSENVAALNTKMPLNNISPTLQPPQTSNLIPGPGNIPNIIPANQLMNKLPNPSNFLSNPNTNQISDELQQGLNPINKIPYQPDLNTHTLGPTLSENVAALNTKMPLNNISPTLQPPQTSNLIPGPGNIPNILPNNQLMNKLPNPNNFLSNPNTNRISDELQQGPNPINQIPYQPDLNTHISGPTPSENVAALNTKMPFNKIFPTLQPPQFSNLIPGSENIPNIIPANQVTNKLPNPNNFLSNPNTNRISDELQQGPNPINQIPYQPDLNTHISGPAPSENIAALNNNMPIKPSESKINVAQEGLENNQKQVENVINENLKTVDYGIQPQPDHQFASGNEALASKSGQANGEKLHTNLETVSTDKLRELQVGQNGMKGSDAKMVPAQNEKMDIVSQTLSTEQQDQQSAYYVVLDDEGNIVHTSDAILPNETKDQHNKLRGLMSQYPGYLIES